MGNVPTCQAALDNYTCERVPDAGAVCLTKDADTGACQCAAFTHQLPGSSGCGLVDLTSTQALASARVTAKGYQYLQGGSSKFVGSDPGPLEYSLLDGADGMSVQECTTVAKQLLKDDSSLESAYCFNQTDSLGFGIATGQHIAQCFGNCPTLSTTMCYFNSCTLVGELLDGLPVQAANALDGYTMDTGTDDGSSEGQAETVADTAETIGSVAGAVGDAL
jgi:hypothetical protein